MLSIDRNIDTLFASDEIYSVSDFFKLLGNTLNKTVPMIWISGEVSNVKKTSSGHIYFSLKDSHAIIRCILFRLSAKRVKFELIEGLKILVNASINIYEARGNIQLIVSTIEPVGIGNIELQLKQLKEKLAKQGLFDLHYKKPIPKFPRSIGVIASKNGAVIKDILRILELRYPYVDIIIYDVLTQGNNASIQIINALNVADSKHYDTIIIARGGGSIEDLYVFNDEKLAHSVFNASTPIISSIGHQIDTTILDFVADYSAPTPSAAAINATPNREDILDSVNFMHNRIIASAQTTYKDYEKYFLLLQRSISTPTFKTQYYALEYHIETLQKNISQIVESKRNILNMIVSKLSKLNPFLILQSKEHQRLLCTQNIKYTINSYIHSKEKILENNISNLNTIMQFLLAKRENELYEKISALEHLSPLKVLSRGYSITTKEYKSITSIASVKQNDILQTTVTDGQIISIVKKIESL